MADATHIEWTDATWNPVTGCSVVSPGCTNCYAMKLAGTRLKHTPSRQGLTVDTKAGPVWNGQVRLNEQWLDQPLRWRRPRRIFVCAHGDLFHESVPDEWIDKVFAVMALAPQHTFQILTKRAARMREYLTGEGMICGRAGQIIAELMGPVVEGPDEDALWALQEKARDKLPPLMERWPLPNVWVGVSVEDQVRTNERIPDLLDTPATTRFVSYEPALGYVDFRTICTGWYFIDALVGLKYHDAPLDGPPGATQPCARIDQIIMGGESGKGARPMHPLWPKRTERDCAETGVAFFFKQWGAWAPTLSNEGEWPANAPGHIRLTADGERALDGWPMQLVGKKAAGRLLNGVTHDAMPAVRA